MVQGQKQAECRRGRFDARVVINRQLCREHYLLRLRITSSFPPTLPGQFVQLGCRTPDAVNACDTLLGGELTWSANQVGSVVATQPELCRPTALLRRPFSLAGRGEDENGTWIELVHRVVGVGTQWLAELGENDAVDLIGPLGNWFEMPADKSIGLLVGGGVGLPPMFYLAEQLQRCNWRAIAFVGAQAHDLLAVDFMEHAQIDPQGNATRCTEQFDRHGFATVITTDDGSRGLRGFITDGLAYQLDRMSRNDKSQAVVFTCGPGPMMQAAANLAAENAVDCQVCLEQSMACGMGTCQSCVVKIEAPDADRHGTTDQGRPWRYRLACSDGPVFRAGQVLW